ncbi:MAG: DUF4315 family protein [Clostridiales bacterium]|jgi:hypothetical protein|nr:DUF4315 family protein [Clostridiales bacterium]
MNPKLQKTIDEIEKLKLRISRGQARLRKLERQKVELENAGIVTLVRGIDIAPDKLEEFARIYLEQQQKNALTPAVPDKDTDVNRLEESAN